VARSPLLEGVARALVVLEHRPPAERHLRRRRGELDAALAELTVRLLDVLTGKKNTGECGSISLTSGLGSSADRRLNTNTTERSGGVTSSQRPSSYGASVVTSKPTRVVQNCLARS